MARESYLRGFDMLNEELMKKAKKKRAPQKFQGKVDLKKILKEKTIRKTNKEMLEAMLRTAYGQFEHELKKYFEGKSKIIDDKQTLVELFTNKKFAKSLLKVTKEQEKNSGVVFYAVSELWLTNVKAFVDNDKLLKEYLEVFAKVDKKRIKQIAEILKIKKSEALQIALASATYKGANMKSLRLRFQSFLNELYGVEGLTTKKAIKVIIVCFSGVRNKFLTYALGERTRKNEDEKENFKIVTDAILTIINRMDKDDRKDLIKFYAKRRQNNNNAPRRISLLGLDEDYHNISKTVSKLIDTGMNKEIFA